MPVPYAVTDGHPLRFDPPDEALYCPECDRTFTAPTRAAVERLYEQHLAEVRDPDRHMSEPF